MASDSGPTPRRAKSDFLLDGLVAVGNLIVEATVSATGQYLSEMPLLKFGIAVQFVIANIYGVLAGVAVEDLGGYEKPSGVSTRATRTCKVSGR